MKATVARLEQESAESREKYLRALADFENYRRRVQQDISCARRSGREQLMLDMLPVLDNLERALAASEPGTGNDSIRKGVELIHRQLAEALARHGLESFSCLGKPFDPREAEAVSFVESDNHDPDTVVEEVCKGYRCEERVLRPSRVVVARATGAVRPEEDEDTGDTEE
jgi:molecular chaperone GrpE